MHMDLLHKPSIASVHRRWSISAPRHTARVQSLLLVMFLAVGLCLNVYTVDAKTYGPSFATSSNPAGATSEDSSGPSISDVNYLSVTFTNPVLAGQTVLGVTVSVRGRRTTTSNPDSRVANDTGGDLTNTQSWTSSSFSTKTFTSNEDDSLQQYVQSQAGAANISFRIEVPSATGTRTAEIDWVKLTVVTAEPTTGGPVIAGQCTAADIHIVVDNSGSVGNQINTLINNINAFMADVEAGIPGTNWRVTTFKDVPASIATSGWGATPPTSFVNGMSIGTFTPTADGIQAAIAGGTNPGGGLTDHGDDILIIVTDGSPNITLDGSTMFMWYQGAADAIAQS